LLLKGWHMRMHVRPVIRGLRKLMLMTRIKQTSGKMQFVLDGSKKVSFLMESILRKGGE
jgi:hypothetical protein